MKRVTRWLKELFDPDYDMDTTAIRIALNDAGTRTLWITSVLEEIKQMNIDVDRRLIAGREVGLSDLCARRQAYKDVLDAVLRARRQALDGPPSPRHNPRVPVDPNLDRVTS